MTFANGMLDDVVPFDERRAPFSPRQRVAVRAAAFGVGTVAAWGVSAVAAAWLTLALLSNPEIKEAALVAPRLPVPQPHTSPATISHKALSTAADVWFSAPVLGPTTPRYGVERPQGSAVHPMRQASKPIPEPLRRPPDLLKPVVEATKPAVESTARTIDPGPSVPEPVARPADLPRNSLELARSGLEAMQRAAAPVEANSAPAIIIPEPVRRPSDLDRPALEAQRSALTPMRPVPAETRTAPLPPVRIAPEVPHVAASSTPSVSPGQTAQTYHDWEHPAVRRQPPTSGRQDAGVSQPRDDRNPLQRFFDAIRQPSGASFAEARPENPWASGGTVPMAGDGRTAVYDIEAHTVYLPDGERLEAHSGLGARLDDPRSVAEKNRGATPPHLYTLELRKQLFHGVAALRLNPVGGGAMYGRVGLLAHTYMLGPNGQSNGCVSFRDYRRFLNAFASGQVNRLVVVSHLGVQGSRMAWRARDVRTAWR